MDIATQIASILKANPTGLKAAEIAAQIGCTRKTVNSYLYSHQDIYEQHDGYIWTFKITEQKKTSIESPAQRQINLHSVGVNVFQRIGDTLISTATIIPKGNGYTISSTNNQIACCDCNRFFSIHAAACPFCGCPIQFVAETYFKQFSSKEQPYPTDHNKAPKQPQLQKLKNCEEDKKKLDLLKFIRTASHHFIGFDIDIDTTSLDTITDIHKNVVKRQELIKSTPISAEMFIQGRGLELHMLSTQTLELVRNRCTTFLDQQLASRYSLESQANALFREAILGRIKCDEHTLMQLRILYNKYAKEYKGNREEFQLAVLDTNGVKQQIDVTFFGTLRSYFRKKSEELFAEAYPLRFRLEDPVKGMQFVAYSNLANINISPSHLKEITSHKNKMLSAESACELLRDIDLNNGLLYRLVEISCNDTIVETEDLHREHAVEKVFLLVGIYDEFGFLTTKIILGMYCEKCKKYYITHSAFLDLVTRGRVNARLLTAELSEYDYDDGNMFSSFSPESLLRKCGYTVNANDALSDERRQKILKSVIDNRLYSPDGIISHLSFLISMSKKVENRDMRYAINKWARDIDYIKKNFHR